jgi:hypothetical protein
LRPPRAEQQGALDRARGMTFTECAKAHMPHWRATEMSKKLRSWNDIEHAAAWLAEQTGELWEVADVIDNEINIAFVG